MKNRRWYLSAMSIALSGTLRYRIDESGLGLLSQRLPLRIQAHIVVHQYREIGKPALCLGWSGGHYQEGALR